MPTSVYDSRMAGPAAAIPALEPTKRPAPITPPIAIIDRWRFLSPAWRPSEAGLGTALEDGEAALVRDVGALMLNPYRWLR
ncbi:hypothetical protein GCM10010095_81540 [Streptomyces anthocyanicus]|nr:hypothetical protein GCM10010095_81540 [Streptomyces anthocyanicus]